MKKLKLTFTIFLTLIVSLSLTILFLSIKKQDFSNKKSLLKTVKLTDLAISTEANYIRHRSLTTIFDIYKDDPDIRVYFPSTFTINEGLYAKK